MRVCRLVCRAIRLQCFVLTNSGSIRKLEICHVRLRHSKLDLVSFERLPDENRSRQGQHFRRQQESQIPMFGRWSCIVIPPPKLSSIHCLTASYA